MRKLRTVEPTAEPLDLEDMRTQLAFTGSVSPDDPYLEDLIAEVRDIIEDQTNGHALITQTWEVWLDYAEVSDVIYPRVIPLQSVTSVKAYDTDDTETALDSAAYQVRTGTDPRVSLNSGYTWGSNLRDYDCLCLTITAGYGDGPENVPRRIRNLIKGIVQHQYGTKGTGIRETASGQLIGVPSQFRKAIASLRVTL